MFSSKVIELEEYFKCSQHNNQPILQVLLDKQVKREERLLCATCTENLEAETNTIGLKKVLQMIQENQKYKVENYQRLIKDDVDLVEQFVNELHKLKSKIILQFDELITNSTQWIISLNGIGQSEPIYSFFDELDRITDSKMRNLLNEDILIDQIKTLNSSFFNKINLEIPALRNNELYSQCDELLIKLNPSHPIKLIDNSNQQQDVCYAISFNQSGSLMISASNCDINIWNFDQGKMNEINKIKGLTNTISCLQFSKKNNSFLSAGFDKSIRCWKQINKKEWQSSQPYRKHSACINCLTINQSQNQLFSGSRDGSIAVWKLSFSTNQLTYLYSLEKHTNHVYSLSINEQEDTLISCGDEQIIIWKKNNKQIWQFGYVVTQSLQEYGHRLNFINDQQFIWVTGNQVSKDCICTFQINDSNYQENQSKEVKLIQNYSNSDIGLFPIIQDKKKNLMIVKHKCHIYFISILNEGYQKILTSIKYESNIITGALTNDGKYLVTWDKVGRKYNIYELYNN